MKKRIHGASRYYASDKNVFDALNQHKVDTPTVMKLFQRRNVIVSNKTSREDLAAYFARLTHDYYDHKDIAARLGIVPRRERITSMDVNGIDNIEVLQVAVEQLKKELEAAGDIVQISRKDDNFRINIQYSSVNYKLSEFAQVQVRDAEIEFAKSGDGSYVLRNTENKTINGVRDSLLGNLEKSSTTLTKTVVSLFDIPSPKLRSKFFYDLSLKLDGYVRQDVNAAYIFKAKPTESGEGVTGEEADTHIERVYLRGNGVARSELLHQLLDDEDYYIIKIVWTVVESLGDGTVYEIEATFSEPKDCTDFSFIVNAVLPIEEGKVSKKRRRSPSLEETNVISKAIEAKSRELVKSLKDEYQNSLLKDS